MLFHFLFPFLNCQVEVNEGIRLLLGLRLRVRQDCLRLAGFLGKHLGFGAQVSDRIVLVGAHDLRREDQLQETLGVLIERILHRLVLIFFLDRFGH